MPSTPKIRPALYLDIDGVLLRRTVQQGLGGLSAYEIASGAAEFLAWAKSQFEVYWLSTRTSGGDNENAARAFRHASPSAMRVARLSELVYSIPAPEWDTAKINGIDLSRPFLWIDDDPDPVSASALRERNMLNRLIEVSVDRTPDLLHGLPKTLAQRLKEL